MPSRRLLLLGLIAFAAAIAGVFIGRLVADAPKASETELHALLHGQLDLTPEQEKKLERIEADGGFLRQGQTRLHLGLGLHFDVAQLLAQTLQVAREIGDGAAHLIQARIQARALSVVKYMIATQGIPADRLAATGFGEFQPLDIANNDEAWRRNRRIEFKITER